MLLETKCRERCPVHAAVIPLNCTYLHRYYEPQSHALDYDGMLEDLRVRGAAGCLTVAQPECLAIP